jgi:hypothetical protein
MIAELERIKDPILRRQRRIHREGEEESYQVAEFSRLSQQQQQQQRGTTSFPRPSLLTPLFSLSSLLSPWLDALLRCV